MSSRRTIPLVAGASVAKNVSPITGEGEMAELTRCFDWSKTPLGPIESWPDTLITTVNLLLESRHPMFFWSGPELIQFYNDAYRPSIGLDKHPSALGQRGIECWPEIWHIIGPQIEAVMTRGEASWHHNQLVPIFRDSKMEEVFWTYSYSPVRDRDGTIRGTLVVCSETTEQVLGERRMRTLLDIASAADNLHRGRNQELGARLIRALSANPSDIPFAALFTLSPQSGAALAGCTGEKTNAMFQQEAWPLGDVAESGTPLLLTDIQKRIGSISFEPWVEPVESAYLLPLGKGVFGESRLLLLGISPRLPFGTSYEMFFRLVSKRITELLDASDGQQQRAQQEKQLQTERARMLDLFQQSPAFIAVVRGPDYVFELANPLYQRLIGDRQVVGLPLREALPELVDQNILPLLDGVYQTGRPFIATDFHVEIEREADRPREELVLDFVYQPMREADGSVSGIIVLGIDVTDRRRTEEALKESQGEAQRQLAELEAIYSTAPIGLALFDPVEFRYLK
ncbi:MAG: PAS domain-containing protein, partial [Candidatus Korobacteraceae bacterium]